MTNNNYNVKEISVVKKLLQNTAALKNYREVFYPEQSTQDKALNELIQELCLTNRLWLNKEEYDKLVHDGVLVKNYRFSNLDSYILELVIKDVSEEFIKTDELENTYRYFISYDMIQSYRLKNDDVFTIHVKY